jgi:hypothetical protein
MNCHELIVYLINKDFLLNSGERESKRWQNSGQDVISLRVIG